MAVFPVLYNIYPCCLIILCVDKYSVITYMWNLKNKTNKCI